MMDRRKLFQELFECYYKLMVGPPSRGYPKRAVQPKCEVQGANRAVRTNWKNMQSNNEHIPSLVD
jgi:hypothetical protein